MVESVRRDELKQVATFHLVQRHHDIAQSGQRDIAGNLKPPPDFRFIVQQFRVELVNVWKWRTTKRRTKRKKESLSELLGYYLVFRDFFGGKQACGATPL